jgi:hypothetical protein
MRYALAAATAVLALLSCCSSLGPKAPAAVKTVTVDCSDATLNAFGDPAARALLERHLASSAAWRLTRFGERPGRRGTLAALRRRPVEGGWETTLHGYISSRGEGPYCQTRTMLRLEEYKPGTSDGWIQNKWYDECRAGEKATVRVNKSKSYAGGAYQSYLLVRGTGVTVEIMDDEMTNERRETTRLLAAVNAELRALLASKTARERGFDPALLAPGSMIVNNDDQLTLADGMQPGIYMVSGYVNPGEKGSVFLLVFNEQTGEEVMLGTEKARTVEYVGWSDKPAEKFWFQSEAWCKVGDWEHEYPARFEVWFEPANKGGAPRLLLVGKRKIFGWES